MDLISDGGSDTNKAIDKSEFGKVAIAHTNKRNTLAPVSYWAGTDDSDAVQKATVWYLDSQNTDNANVDTDGMLTAAALLLIQRRGDSYYLGDGETGCDDAGTSDVVEKCDKMATFYVHTATTATRNAGAAADQATTTTTRETFYAEATAARLTDSIGHKSTHVAVEFSVGGITPYVGYSEMKKNGAKAESKPRTTA